MPSFERTLTDTWQPLVDLSALRILYFHLELINYDGNLAKFTFGDPNLTTPDIILPGKASTNKDNRALRGVLYGKTDTGTSAIQINIW